MFRNVKLIEIGAPKLAPRGASLQLNDRGKVELISVFDTADWQIGGVFAQFEPEDATALFEAKDSP